MIIGTRIQLAIPMILALNLPGWIFFIGILGRKIKY